MCALICFADGNVAGSATELAELGHPPPEPHEIGDGAPDHCLCGWGRTGVRAYLDRVFPGRFVEGPTLDWDEIP